MNFFLNIKRSKEMEEHRKTRKINDLINPLTALPLLWQLTGDVTYEAKKDKIASNLRVIKPECCFSFKRRTKGTH